MGITVRHLRRAILGPILIAVCLPNGKCLGPQDRERPNTFVFPLNSNMQYPLPRISRDGTRIAYLAGKPRSIYVREIDSSASHPVQGSTGNASDSGCFSPDGSQIAFASEGRSVLKRAPVDANGATTLVEGMRIYGFCDWAEDGYIYFATPAFGLMRVPESGGRVDTLLEWDGDGDASSYGRPQLLPGATELLYSDDEPNFTRVMAVDLETGETTKVIDDAEFIGYVPPAAEGRLGHLIFGRAGRLLAGEFDTVAFGVGSISPILDQTWQVSVSNSGTLVYPTAASEGTGPTLGWVDRDGDFTQIDAPAREYRDLNIAPDGQSAVVSVFHEESLAMDLWIQRLDGNQQTRLTDGEIAHSAVWTADGSHLVYGSESDWYSPLGSLRTISVADGRQPRTLLSGIRLPVPTSLSPDGSLLLGSQSVADENGFTTEDIWTLMLNQTSPADHLSYLLQSGFEKLHATFSPNGRWVAYSSDESGRREVWIVSYPDLGIRARISTDGGGSPRWNRNGREVFYLSGSRLMSAEIQLEPELRVSTPTVLFDDASLISQSSETAMHGFSYDVAPDGQRFMIITPPVPPDLQIQVLRATFGE